MTVDDLMQTQPVIPVIVIDDLADAIPLAETMVEAGLPVLEVTLRTDAALAAIRAMTKVKGAIVGAGTVLNDDQLKQALDAGSTFIVTPGLSESVVMATPTETPILPGVATATELMMGLDLGLTRFKFFPAEQAGGVKMLKALESPFNKVKFCPTGGISQTSAPDYLALANVACVGGGWLAPKALLAAKDWAGISRLARDAAALKR
jgi:2-dehydro-3-deoxyphosphogluconate aldolase/(4S)-4-hydroxy-2-oxoglutarate aldolase